MGFDAQLMKGLVGLHGQAVKLVVVGKSLLLHPLRQSEKIAERGAEPVVKFLSLPGLELRTVHILIRSNEALESTNGCAGADGPGSLKAPLDERHSGFVADQASLR